MADVILQIGASKLALSVGLAGVAWTLGRRLGNPPLAHGLWLLPLAVLVVPPFVAVPVWSAGIDTVTPADAIGLPQPGPAPSTVASLPNWLGDHGKEALVWLWLMGTASVLGGTLARTLRFHRLLGSASETAPREVQRLAREISLRLGLGSVPTVYATRAQLSPMLWWAGGKARVLLPSELLTNIGRSELRCILAHELAHLRRRDHVVRWLEWLACAAFWWNPAAWWTRRRLRASEELCCDALAVSAITADPRTYAGALLRVIDFMSKTRTPGPLAFASPIDRRGRASRLERRLFVIVTNRTPTPSPTPTWLRGVRRCGAVCLLAGGFIYCTDQSDLTSVDPALVAPNHEEVARFDGGRDDPAADRTRQVIRALVDGIAAHAREHALPVQLAEALGAAGERAVSGEAVRLLGSDGEVAGLRGGAADAFIAVTPDDGAGDSKTVVMDLAGLRSVLSEGPLPPEALRAELARHLRVSRNPKLSPFQSLFEGVHLECTGASISVLRTDDGDSAGTGMTCETAETSTGRLRVKAKEPRPKD